MNEVPAQRLQGAKAIERYSVVRDLLKQMCRPLKIAAAPRLLDRKSLIVEANLFILDRQREVNQHANQVRESIHSPERVGVLGEDRNSVAQLAQTTIFMSGLDQELIECLPIADRFWPFGKALEGG